MNKRVNDFDILSQIVRPRDRLICLAAVGVSTGGCVAALGGSGVVPWFLLPFIVGVNGVFAFAPGAEASHVGDYRGLRSYSDVRNRFADAIKKRRLPLVANERVDIAENKGSALHLNPNFFEKSDPRDVVAVLAHEVVHSCYGYVASHYLAFLKATTFLATGYAGLLGMPVEVFAIGFGVQHLVHKAFNRHIERVCDRGSVVLTGERRLGNVLDKEYDSVWHSLQDKVGRKSLLGRVFGMMEDHPNPETRREAMDSFHKALGDGYCQERKAELISTLSAPPKTRESKVSVAYT